MSDQPEIVYLPVAEIQENRWNPNVVDDATMASLIANIRRVGFHQPILVRPNTTPGERAYEVVDGEHRLRAARAAALEFVPCVVSMLDAAEARAQTIAMNQLRGDMDPAQLAALVREIEEGGIPAEHLVEFSGFTADDLDQLDRMLSVDWSAANAPPGAAPADRTTPQSDDERWVDLRVRVPYTVALLFRSELDRLKDVRDTSHDHLALELMVLNSAHVPPEEM